MGHGRDVCWRIEEMDDTELSTHYVEAHVKRQRELKISSKSSSYAELDGYKISLLISNAVFSAMSVLSCSSAHKSLNNVLPMKLTEKDRDRVSERQRARETAYSTHICFGIEN